MSSREDIPTSDQRLQSPQRRMKSPKTGREEKTRKMARVKIINLPRLPVPLTSKQNVSGLIIVCAMQLSFHLPTHVKTTKGEGARRHGRFPKPQWPSGITRKTTGNNGISISWKGCLKRGRTDYVALGLNLEERKGWKGAGRKRVLSLVDGNVERGRAAMAAFPNH